MLSFLGVLRRAPWTVRLFLLTLAGNVLLIGLGILVAPSTLGSVEGWWSLLGAAGLQVALAVVALVGPFSLVKHAGVAGISLGFGALFAAIYLGFLVRDITGSTFGFDDGPLVIYLLFIGTALLAGVLASSRSQRFGAGVMAAVWALVIGTTIWSLGDLVLNYTLWGSAYWYQYWLQDGAIDEFRSSGSTDLGAFLLQDLQGALFFHQVLSVVIGAIGGAVGSGIGLGGARIWSRLRPHRPAATAI